MPSKVQLKLLSNSGELLSVANCCAGKISVLRASNPSDLRPYQRALVGSSGKDNLEILCDGNAFHPDQHTLIGFGEQSPTTGLTVREFTTKQGVSALALASQLLTIGLEDVIDKRCSELTLDQEARLRLLGATGDPDKAIIINDPFENISGKWRERVAEILAEFARSRNALIIIPSLSYRPEAWIANDTIERIEVGQTSQRTIGFGAAGSQSNAPIDDIRNQLRSDPRFAGQFSDSAKGAITSGAIAGISAGIRAKDLDPAATTVIAHKSWLPIAGKLLFGLVGSSVGGWALFTAVTNYTTPLNRVTPTTKSAPLNKSTDANSNRADTSEKNNAPKFSVSENARPSAVAALNVGPKTAPETQSTLLLDKYPPVIKASILDTVRGIVDFSTSNESHTSEPLQHNQANSGNLFSLLAAASNSKGEVANPETSDNYGSNEAQEDEQGSPSMSAEEAQREAIRARFLEAIRASALRRQAESEEQEAE
jgi:hypothetical protein